VGSHSFTREGPSVKNLKQKQWLRSFSGAGGKQSRRRGQPGEAVGKSYKNKGRVLEDNRVKGRKVKKKAGNEPRVGLGFLKRGSRFDMVFRREGWVRPKWGCQSQRSSNPSKPGERKNPKTEKNEGLLILQGAKSEE